MSATDAPIDEFVTRISASPQQILLITGLFTPGGAERVLTLLANHWVAGGHRVTAMALGDTLEKPFFPFSAGIDVRVLGLQGDSSNAMSGLIRNFRRVFSLRKALRSIRPKVVVSFLDRTNVLTLLAARGLDIPVIVGAY